MNSLNIIFVLLALVGFLPLLIILYRRKQVKNILATGLRAKARVYEVIRMGRSAAEMVRYKFYDESRTRLFYGAMTTGMGLHKTDDVIDIFYLQNNPKKNTVPGAWKSNGILVFGIAIAVFVLFAVYKLYTSELPGHL